MRRRLVARALVAIVVAAAAVPSAWAFHRFTDVPDLSPFHAAIGSMSDAGITGGKTCDPPGTPPTYCPKESITREAMAAFVHRGLGRVAHAFKADVPIGGNGASTVASLTIKTGGTPGRAGFILLRFTGEASLTSLTDCPCRAVFTLDGGTQVLEAATTLDAIPTTGSVAGIGFGSVSSERVIYATTGTTYTFKLIAYVDVSANPTTNDTIKAGGSVSAIYVPFDGRGES